MNDNLPPEEPASDMPVHRRGFSSSTTAGLVLISLLILYPLSLGPVARWYVAMYVVTFAPPKREYTIIKLSATVPPPDPPWQVTEAYRPLMQLCVFSPFVEACLRKYVNLWGCELFSNKYP